MPFGYCALRYLHVDGAEPAHRIANRVTFTGVAAWITLMVVMAMIVSVVLGWR